MHASRKAPAPTAFGHVVKVGDPQGAGERDGGWPLRFATGSTGYAALCYAKATLPESKKRTYYFARLPSRIDVPSLRRHGRCGSFVCVSTACVVEVADARLWLVRLIPCYGLDGMLESRPVVTVGARLMAGRLTLDQLVGVQISSPQLAS